MSAVCVLLYAATVGIVRSASARYALGSVGGPSARNRRRADEALVLETIGCAVIA